MSKKPRFLVRSPEQGLKVIQHPAITKNFEAALRWRPKHKKAVLVPCAGTKPFPDSPSHAHGYLPALEGKQADLWVVSEPLGVVPYAWSRKPPQNDYDFPPQFLRGKAHAVLAARIARWLKQVGPKYDTVVLALPGHHMRLVDTALGLLKKEPTRIVRAGIGECLDEGACPTGHYRATTESYRGFLKARANPPERRYSDQELDDLRAQHAEVRQRLDAARRALNESEGPLDDLYEEAKRLEEESQRIHWPIFRELQLRSGEQRAAHSLPDSGHYPDLMGPPEDLRGASDPVPQPAPAGFRHYVYDRGRVHLFQRVVGGNVVSGLTVVAKRARGGLQSGTIDRVNTHPGLRRKGYAADLLRYARSVMRVVEHSRDLTSDGKAWKRSVKNPAGHYRATTVNSNGRSPSGMPLAAVLSEPAFRKIDRELFFEIDHNGEFVSQGFSMRSQTIAGIDLKTGDVTLVAHGGDEGLVRLDPRLPPFVHALVENGWGASRICTRHWNPDQGSDTRHCLGLASELDLEAEAHVEVSRVCAWERGQYPPLAEFRYRSWGHVSELVFYHATRKSHLRSIKSQGLLPSQRLRDLRGPETPFMIGWTEINFDLQDAVYLTGRLLYAEQIASILAGRWGEPAVIVAVKGSSLDLRDVSVDEDALRDRFTGDVQAANCMRSLPAYFTSLFWGTLSVAYLNAIPPSELRFVKEVAPEFADETDEYEEDYE